MDTLVGNIDSKLFKTAHDNWNNKNHKRIKTAFNKQGSRSNVDLLLETGNDNYKPRNTFNKTVHHTRSKTEYDHKYNDCTMNFMKKQRELIKRNQKEIDQQEFEINNDKTDPFERFDNKYETKFYQDQSTQ